MQIWGERHPDCIPGHSGKHPGCALDALVCISRHFKGKTFPDLKFYYVTMSYRVRKAWFLIPIEQVLRNK